MSNMQGCFDCCLSSAYDYVTNPESHPARFFKSSEGRDKVLKFADPIFSLSYEIGKATGASESTLEGIGKGRSLAKAGRDAHSFLNIFAGVIAALVLNMINIWNLMKGLVGAADVVPLKREVSAATDSEGKKTYRYHKEEKGKTTDRPAKYNEIAVGKAEQLFALGANFGKGTGAATYTLGFGVCRPIANIEKYCGVKFGERAHKFGQAFQTVMTVCHIGGIVGNSSELIYQSLAFDRVVSDRGDIQAAYQELSKKSLESTVGLAEKSFEFMQDIGHFSGVAAPLWFSIPTGLLIGFFGCYKEWLKTETAAA